MPGHAPWIDRLAWDARCVVDRPAGRGGARDRPLTSRWADAKHLQ